MRNLQQLNDKHQSPAAYTARAVSNVDESVSVISKT